MHAPTSASQTACCLLTAVEVIDGCYIHMLFLAAITEFLKELCPGICSHVPEATSHRGHWIPMLILCTKILHQTWPLIVHGNKSLKYRSWSCIFVQSISEFPEGWRLKASQVPTCFRSPLTLTGFDTWPLAIARACLTKLSKKGLQNLNRGQTALGPDKICPIESWCDLISSTDQKGASWCCQTWDFGLEPLFVQKQPRSRMHVSEAPNSNWN